MKLEMTSLWLPFIQPGLYGTSLGDIYNDVAEEYQSDFKSQLAFEYQTVMNEIFDEDWIVAWLGNIIISNCVLKSPHWYNYENDSIEFDMEIDTEKLIHNYYERFKAWDIDEFFKWTEKNYGNHSGFISFFPYLPHNFEVALYSIQGNYDFERAVAMLLTFAIEKNRCATDSYQKDLEANMIDYCHDNEMFEWQTEEEE